MSTPSTGPNEKGPAGEAGPSVRSNLPSPLYHGWAGIQGSRPSALRQAIDRACSAILRATARACMLLGCRDLAIRLLEPRPGQAWDAPRSAALDRLVDEEEVLS